MTAIRLVSDSTTAVTQVNTNFDAVSPAGLYGYNAFTTSGLTFGYYGGQFNGVTVADGTVALTASATNYLVAHRTTGAVTAATTTTNWANTATYLQLYQVVVGSASITSKTDFRQAFGEAASGGGGMSNPMTASGDVIYGGTSGTPTRLAAGTNGYVLTLAAGVPTWAAATGGFSNPMTAVGDLILGGTSGAAGRLGIGSAGQVLTVSSGTAAWVTPGTGGTVTSVAAQGGVETVSGSAITASGTVQSNTLVNAQSGTSYTYVTGDRAKLVTHTNASAIAGSLPQAGSAGFPAGWFMELKNIGAGSLTVTPTTSTIDGASNTVLTTGQSIVVVSDGTNWITLAGKSSGGGGLTYTAEALNTASPNNTTNVVSFTVTGGTTQGFLALVPKGSSGGILAAVPDSTSTGGNVRGTRAVDLQLTRGAATQVASGQESVSLGSRNTASGAPSYAIGDTNTASNTYATSFGFTNTASGYASINLGGQLCTADGNRSATLGGSYLSTKGIIGMVAFGAAGFTVAGVGKRQSELYSLAAATADATATKMGTDGAAGSSANQILLNVSSCVMIEGVVTARQNTTGDTKGWTFQALVKQGANAAATALVGTPTVTSSWADSGASAWTIALVADTTNGALTVQVTGEAAKSIAWTCSAMAARVMN